MPGDVYKGNAGVGLGTDLCGAMDRRSRRQCRQKTEPPCTRSVRTSGVGGQPRLIMSRGHLPDSGWAGKIFFGKSGGFGPKKVYRVKASPKTEKWEAVEADAEMSGNIPEKRGRI